VLLAAYIGGIGFFRGPIIGAILVTWLQVMLSDITEVWQLYFGLLFVGMVIFAPFGISGLLMMHAPLWRARVLGASCRLSAGACRRPRHAHGREPHDRDGLSSFGPRRRTADDVLHARCLQRAFLAAVAHGGGALDRRLLLFARTLAYVEGAWHDALMKARERERRLGRKMIGHSIMRLAPVSMTRPPASASR